MKDEFLKRTISSILLIPLISIVIIKGSYLFFFLITACIFLCTYEWLKIVKKKHYKYFGILFFLLSFYSIYNLRNIESEGIVLVFFVLIICVSTDIGGYTLGKILKGPKLTKISPNKTYSGLIGSYIFSIISVSLFLKTKFALIFLNSDVKTIIVTLVLSSISQIGDLIISYFKRLHNIKDTGRIIPGHGGILDRIDGMLFAFPFFYFLYIFEVIK